MTIYAGSSANQLKREMQFEREMQRTELPQCRLSSWTMPRHWEAIREAERRAYEEAQRQKEEDNQRVLREMERKSAWREHLPPVVHTEQEELDARALYYGNREREIFRRGRALRC